MQSVFQGRIGYTQHEISDRVLLLSPSDAEFAALPLVPLDCDEKIHTYAFVFSFRASAPCIAYVGPSLCIRY